MRTSAQAVVTALNYARTQRAIRVGWCDHYVATYYGLSHSGFTSAINHYFATPTRYRHGVSTSPPPGALVFWGGGAGHIALSVGNGLCASTDYPRSGHVGVAEITSITANWHKPYVGWTDAYYASQGTVVIGHAPAPKPVPSPEELPVDQATFNSLMHGFLTSTDGQNCLTVWANSPGGRSALAAATWSYKNAVITDKDTYAHLVTASGLPLKVTP